MWEAAFSANGKTYETNMETIALMNQYRDAGNEEMLGAVFTLGISYGVIRETADTLTIPPPEKRACVFCPEPLGRKGVIDTSKGPAHVKCLWRKHG